MRTPAILIGAPHRAINLVLVLAATVLLLSSASESSTAARRSAASLAHYQDNPYQYLYGSVVNATVFRLGNQQFTNLEVKPVQTYPMFSQFVTFCGNQKDKFDVATPRPVVLVYSRTMPRRDCFELFRVDVIDRAHQTGSSGE